MVPICSSAASPRCLPGRLQQTLSSTLFSISCSHLLEISFSFRTSPWTQEWAFETPRSGLLRMPVLKIKRSYLFDHQVLVCSGCQPLTLLWEEKGLHEVTVQGHPISHFLRKGWWPHGLFPRTEMFPPLTCQAKPFLVPVKWFSFLQLLG